MMESDRYERNDQIMWGVLTSAAAFFGGLALGGLDRATDWGSWFYDYQTVLTGAVALFAAVVAYRSARMHMKHDRLLATRGEREALSSVRELFRKPFENIKESNDLIQGFAEDEAEAEVSIIMLAGDDSYNGYLEEIQGLMQYLSPRRRIQVTRMLEHSKNFRKTAIVLQDFKKQGHRPAPIKLAARFFADAFSRIEGEWAAVHEGA